MYYYLNAAGSHATDDAVLAYTHDDTYKPVAGFKTVTGHFHLELNEMVRDRGTADFQPTWVPVFRGLGINVVYLGDFHDDSDQRDAGPKRLPEQKAYFEAARKAFGQEFSGDAAGRGELVLRRALVPDDAEAGVLYALADRRSGRGRSRRMWRGMARFTTSGRRTRC